MRYTSAGESHGPALTVIVTDVPAGLEISKELIDAELRRRQMGYGRGGRMLIESDEAKILSGVRFGKSIGSPIALMISNRDYENWAPRMSAQGAPPPALVKEQTPRPGHADLVGAIKTNTDDCRNVLERSSARETACRVAAGSIAKQLLATLGIEVASYVTRIGEAALPEGFAEQRGFVFDNAEADASATRCPDPETTERMKAAIDEARAAGESLGGWFTVTVTGLMPGLGGYAQARDRLTAQIGGALFSIPAIKGVEFGLGFGAGTLPGSKVHDPIAYDDLAGFYRESNNAGGLEGGMTNGEPLVVHACMKPIPTMTSPLRTVDISTLEPAFASKERSDVCAVPAAAVVAEAEVALVLANACQAAFGGSCIEDFLVNAMDYVDRTLNFRPGDGDGALPDDDYPWEE